VKKVREETQLFDKEVSTINFGQLHDKLSKKYSEHVASNAP